MHEYTACIRDIDRALAADARCDDRQTDAWRLKLTNRRATAMTALQTNGQNEPPDTFVPPDLYKSPNANVAGVSGVVTVHRTKHKGRHFIANEHIPAGAVLVVEEGYVALTSWTLGKSRVFVLGLYRCMDTRTVCNRHDQLHPLLSTFTTRLAALSRLRPVSCSLLFGRLYPTVTIISQIRMSPAIARRRRQSFR
jgi:hypothetical protein